MASLNYISDIRQLIRLTSTAFDGEISDLIDSAQQDLILSGVLSAKATNETDMLVKRAVASYVKAYFGYDNPDYDRLLRAYDLLKNHLCLSADYTVVSA